MRMQFWSSFLAVALSAACVTPGDEAESNPVQLEDLVPHQAVQLGSGVSARSALGVERVVPVRFYVLDDAQRSCPSQLTMATVAGALREANAVFLPAGVQFTLAGLQTYVTPTFRDFARDTKVSWSSVWPELATVIPGVNGGLYLGRRATDEQFVHAAATRLPPDEIPVFVPCSSPITAYASFPWFDTSNEFWRDDSRVVVISAGAFGSPDDTGIGFKQQTLAHEIGHYLGLPHPFDLGAMLAAGDTTAADFYDLFYAVDFVVPRFLTSAAEVRSLTPGFRRIKSGNGMGTGGTAQCAVSTSDGDLTCTWAGITFRTSTDPAALDGLGFTYGPGVYGVNLMDYLTVPGLPESRWNALASLSGTQIERVRKVLRSGAGQRNRLGRMAGPVAEQRDYFGFSGVELDFSGDGLRDLAYFDWDQRSCVVRASGTGEVTVIPLPDVDLARGDTPIAADLDRDGRTDCVVFRPGTGIGDAEWLHWPSSSPPPAPGVSRRPIQFGSLGDVPFANVKIKTGGAPSTWGVFTPGTGTFWWRVDGANWSVPLGDAGSHLALADYDMDGYTDLATWGSVANGAARLSIRRSRENYAVVHDLWFGQIGDVPLGPVMREGNAPTFAVYRPVSGQWFYLEGPGYGDAVRYTVESWGLSTDVPLPGFDFDNDGSSDPAVYRPATDASGLGVLYVRGSTGQGYAVAVGRAGDVPFLAKDHNGDGPPELYLYRTSTGTYYYVPSVGFSYPAFEEVPFGSYVYPPY